MDQGALSALQVPFELLAGSPFDLQAVCIVAATEDLRARRALVQKRSRAGSERFSTSDGRFVEIVLCGIPGDGMRFAPLAKAAEQCVGRDEPWLWTVFTLAWQSPQGSPLWAGRFQAGRLVEASAFPHFESVLPVNVATSSVHAIDVLIGTPLDSRRGEHNADDGPSDRRVPLTSGQQAVWDALDGHDENAPTLAKLIDTRDDTIRHHVIDLRAKGYEIETIGRGRSSRYIRPDAPPP